MRYMRDQKSMSERIRSRRESGCASEVMALAKKMPWVGCPEPAMMEKPSPTIMIIHSDLLKDAINLIRTQREYFCSLSCGLSASTLLEIDFVLLVLPRASFSSSGSTKAALPAELDPLLNTSSATTTEFSIFASSFAPIRCAAT